MARLYARSRYVECEVELSVSDNVFFIDPCVLWKHGVDYRNYWHRTYQLCLVSEGICWAAVSIREMGNKQLRIEYVVCDDETIRQHVLMSDLLID